MMSSYKMGVIHAPSSLAYGLRCVKSSQRAVKVLFETQNCSLVGVMGFCDVDGNYHTGQGSGCVDLT